MEYLFCDKDPECTENPKLLLESQPHSRLLALLVKPCTKTLKQKVVMETSDATLCCSAQTVSFTVLLSVRGG